MRLYRTMESKEGIKLDGVTVMADEAPSNYDVDPRSDKFAQANRLSQAPLPLGSVMDGSMGKIVITEITSFTMLSILFLYKFYLKIFFYYKIEMQLLIFLDLAGISHYSSTSMLKSPPEEYNEQPIHGLINASCSAKKTCCHRSRLVTGDGARAHVVSSCARTCQYFPLIFQDYSELMLQQTRTCKS